MDTMPLNNTEKNNTAQKDTPSFKKNNLKDEYDKSTSNHGKLEKIVPVDTDKTSEVLRKIITIMSSVIIIVCLIVLVASTFGKKRW